MKRKCTRRVRGLCCRCLTSAALIGSVVALAAEQLPGKEQRRESAVGRQIANFVLPDAAGKLVGLSDFSDSRLVVVVFLGTQCPIGNAYLPVLNDLQSQYADKHVQLIGINANPGDSAEAVARHAHEFNLRFPVLVDADQDALQLFGARRTCEVYVLDVRRVVRYRGRIDDRFGYDYKRDQPRRHDLRGALDELLSGRPVSIPETEPAGCLITRRRPLGGSQGPTYAEHIAPIFREQCADCHHPGTAAPFSLLTYDDAVNWSEMIREVVVQRRMPPWHADPRFGRFRNERRLSAEEIAAVVAWTENGTPRGDDLLARPLADPPRELADGWRIGKPDVVFRMPREFTVPAQGAVRYQYFTTPTNFEQDVWVQAAECRPGNRAAVHHIIVFSKERGAGKAPVWIAATAPGADPVVFPEGVGRKIPAGAELMWQMHYTPTGKEERDRSEIGLVFCKEPPRHSVQTYGIANHSFRIPPGAASHEVVSQVPVIKDTVLLAFMPHMHLRGKDFLYEVVYPDNRRETLLSVPQYDFNWQHTYRLETPLRIPRGATIRCVAHFDNSADNPANPDAAQTVRWGDQTWEEMMIGYVDYYWDDSSTDHRP